MRPEIGHTIDPVKDVLRVGFPSESNTLSARTHVCALLLRPVSPFVVIASRDITRLLSNAERVLNPPGKRVSLPSFSR